MPDLDPFTLQRFVDAQQPVYAQVTAELAAGTKTSHWTVSYTHLTLPTILRV